MGSSVKHKIVRGDARHRLSCMHKTRQPGPQGTDKQTNSPRHPNGSDTGNFHYASRALGKWTRGFLSLEAAYHGDRGCCAVVDGIFGAA